MKIIEDIYLDSYSSSEKFWRAFLRGFTAPITLPMLTPDSLSHPSRQTKEVRLLGSKTSDLITFAQNHKLTLYTFIQGAVAILLSHYTRETDILFGAMIKELDFNIVPMRISVEADASVLSWLTELQTQCYFLGEYKSTPLLQIQQWSEIPPEVPLFETLLICGNYENIEHLEEARYLLILSIDAESDLLLRINYQQTQFADDAIDRMLGHLETILTNIIALPEQTLANIPLLTEWERHQLLVEWNQTQTDYPQDKCIHELFEEQVAKTPDTVAVVFENEKLTYRELNQRANQLANYLQSLGVQPEFLVGICTERSIEMIVGILGILKAGGAYVPLDIAYPKERLAFILSDSQLSIILTQQHLVERLPRNQARVVCLDNDWEDIVKIPIQHTEITVEPDNLAYIIYTSGSTGKPKGVIILHHNVVCLFAATQPWFQFNNNDVWSCFHSYAFDFSVWEIWGALLYGGRLVIIPYYVSRSPELFYKLLSQEGITILNQTPSAFKQLIQLETSLNNHSDLSLRFVIFGGEALDIQSLKPWVDKHRDKFTQLVNMYGITETTVHVTYRPINIDDLNSSPKVIGCAIPNLQLYILNSHLQPVPVGVAGEIYVGGAGLARGYLNNLELTAERFIPHPFNNQAKARLYKTGDLARYLPSGDIEYLGRIDNQVKIRGFRIELGEIEALLNQHPNLREAKVISREDIPGDKRLVAYVITNLQENNQGEISQKIREYLKEKLPDYMIPSAFVVLDTFPLTPNGKIDHRALPTVNFLATQSNYVAPRTPTEEIIAQIWSQVLKVETIGMNENFFELGGHSLLATQVISRIRQTLSLELSLLLLFEYPTIAQISEQISNTEQTNNPVLESPIDTRNPQIKLSLSFAQQRIWFLDQLQPDSTAYNLSYSFQIKGKLNISTLKKCIGEIVQRHEILHTNFVAIDGQVTQVITNNIEFNLPIIDLQILTNKQRKIEAQKITKEEAEKPFNLAEGSLFSVKLLQLSAEDFLMLFNIHHIIFDGWSFGVLFDELKVLYTAYYEGLISPLPKLSIQYADFSLWQRKWLTGAILESQLNYWQQQLGGNLPILELPTDRLRPRVQSYQGAIKTFILYPELTASITSFAQKEAVTLFMTLLTAFKVLLCRYSGQEDVIVGTPIAGRNRREIEGLMGFFVNTLALRTDLGNNPSFNELLSRVRRICLEAYTHQDVPFEQLVEILQRERNLSHTPIFQVMFALQNEPMGELQLPDLTLTPLKPAVQTAKFDLTLSMEERNGQLIGEWEYNTDLFDDSTIERMSEHFKILLSGILTDSNQNIWQLPLLTEAEKHQLLLEWNQNKINYSQTKWTHKLFEEQVEKTPHAIAVIFEEQKITYQELNQRANQLANYLQKLGVNADKLVGLCLEISLARIIGLLAILKAGGVYVPLDPVYPQERLRFIIEDAQVSILLTQESLADKFLINSLQVVNLDGDWEKIATESTNNLQSCLTGENLAYVIYTSGSTGTPKGVLIEHQAIAYHCQNIVEHYQLNASDRILQSVSLSFDVSLEQILPTLTVGATVILVDAQSLTPWEFHRKLIDYSLTVIAIPIAYLTQWLQSLDENTYAIDINELRLVICGGEVLPPGILKIWYNSPMKGICLINAYGPTETSITAITFTIPQNIKLIESYTNIPIGRPLPNRRIYILDHHKNSVPIGVAGELYIGGIGLARGYLNRPELTDEKFVPSPFDNSRLYKTGDVASYLPDGNIQFLGRTDSQVKIRGFRIELGEIEAILNQHPNVKAARIITREDIPGDQRLVAYIIPNFSTEVTGTSKQKKFNQEFTSLQLEIPYQIRNYLKQQLPDYMIPAAFVVLETFPLTTNGKINHCALPAPDFWAAQSNYVAPRTPTEEIIVQIWSQVLKVENIGIDDNFFELGGHSLLATLLISRLRQTFNQEIPLILLFEYPTVSQLYEQIRITERENNSLLLPPIEPTIQRKENLPLSFSQKRLWFLAQLEPNSTAYTMPLTLRLQGLLNITALERSIAVIIKRHEILRTNFISTDGQPIQVITKNINWDLPITDLQLLPDEQRDIEAAKISQQEAETPFNLAEDRLVRVKLLRLSAEEYLLIFNIHHIIFDGWSFGVLFAELKAIYTSYCQGLTSALPQLYIQYADFILWQRQWLTRKFLESQLVYWQQQLGGILPILKLPIDRPRPRIQTYIGATKSFIFSKELTASLKSLYQEEGVTLYMVLLTTFKVLLCRYSGQEDVIVGTPIAGRNRREIEGLMGFFVNTLALRTDLGNNPSFNELLSRVRRVCLEAYTHQDLPFEQLVEVLGPERDLSHTPVFQVMFTLQNSLMGELQLPDLTVTTLEPAVQTAKFDLTVSLTEENGQLIGEWQYNTHLFDTSTIERMIEHFQMLLSGILTDSNQKIWQLPLITEQERHQLLVEWNQTQKDYPHDKCIHHLFAEQAEKTPDAVAVVFKNQQITYGKLNQRANQLANYLQTLGVQPEVLVGIYTERSIEMVIGLLGILKAGGAYVPLDINYPTERIYRMLDDAKVGVLLTQKHLLAKINQLPLVAENKLVVGSLDEDIQDLLSGNTLKSPHCKNLAYVIYTSGSTGKPKGVGVEHGQLLNYVKGILDRLDLPTAANFATVSPFFTDLGNTMIFSALCIGGCLHIIAEEVATDPVAFTKYNQSYFLDCLKIVPSHLSSLLTGSEPEKLLPRQRLILGGEAASWELIKRVNKLAPKCQIFNHYGPTETTVGVLTYPLGSASTEALSNTVLLGRPLVNTQIYVLDQYRQPVPLGVSGEIYVGGDSVARGYINRSELTAERFIPNLFSNEPDAKLYKTGDLARYLSDGNLEFLGRIDDQVKIRGFRIELGEIEAVLNQHPSLRETKVITREDIPGKERLIAYIIPTYDQNSPLEISHKIRKYLKQQLPDYMIPAAFVVLESFPLTANGKIDYYNLPIPDFRNLESEGNLQPADNLELQLIKIWENVLGIQPIGLSDNFFDLGGHSLLAVTLFAQIHKTFGKNIPLTYLFQCPTIRQLANVLRQEGCSTLWSSLVPIQTKGSKPPFFYIHTASGGLIHSLNLLSKLDADQPVYGLQAQGLDGKSSPHTCIEDMASHYIQEIQTIQLHGPYLLGGWCAGGMIAYEMAQQLHAQGESVKLLTIFDAYPLQMIPTDNTVLNPYFSIKTVSRTYSSIMDMIKRNRSYFGHLTFKQQIIAIWEKINRRIQDMIKDNLYQFYVKRNLPLPHALSNLAVRDAIVRAYRSYCPQVYPGKIIFFRAIDHMEEYARHMEKWEELATASVEIHDISGNHDSIMSEPHVLVLAQKLKDCLNR